MNLTESREKNAHKKQQMSQDQCSQQQGIKHKSSSALFRFIDSIIRCLGRGIEYLLGLLGQEYYEEGGSMEQKWVEDAVRSIYLTVDADDPFEAFCTMTDEQRQLVLMAIGENFAMLYGFSTQPPRIVPFDSPTTVGCFVRQDNTIYLNEALFTNDKLQPYQAKLIISTMIHELFHQFQYNAAQVSQVSDIPSELIDSWKSNFEHYITYEQDPLAYPLQPLEFYAITLTDCFLAKCEDKDFTDKILQEINENEEDEEYELV